MCRIELAYVEQKVASSGGQIWILSLNSKRIYVLKFLMFMSLCFLGETESNRDLIIEPCDCV